MADFVGGKTSLGLEDFSESFIKQRTLYWLRRVKAEKMRELMASYRPTPLPRTAVPTTTIHNSTSHTSPLHSLPPQHMLPPSHLSDPTVSLPPYPARGGMPQPQIPSSGSFPVVAYPPHKQHVPRPAARQGHPGPPPPYAGQYSKMNQHRY